MSNVRRCCTAEAVLVSATTPCRSSPRKWDVGRSRGRRIHRRSQGMPVMPAVRSFLGHLEDAPLRSLTPTLSSLSQSPIPDTLNQYWQACIILTLFRSRGFNCSTGWWSWRWNEEAVKLKCVCVAFLYTCSFLVGAAPAVTCGKYEWLGSSCRNWVVATVQLEIRVNGANILCNVVSKFGHQKESCHHLVYNWRRLETDESLKLTKARKWWRLKDIFPWCYSAFR